MIIALAAAIVAAPAANYFPLTPGAVWEYAMVGGPTVGPSRIVYKAKEAIDASGKTVTPVEVWIDQELDSTIYYGAAEGYHAMFGSDKEKLLTAPVPFLPVEPKRGQKWEFIGNTIVLGGAAAQKSNYTVNGIEKVDYLGKKVDALKVTQQAEAFIEHAGLLKTKTIDWYVDGVGRVRSDHSVEVKNGAKVSYVLIRAEGIVR